MECIHPPLIYADNSFMDQLIINVRISNTYIFLSRTYKIYNIQIRLQSLFGNITLVYHATIICMFGLCGLFRMF